MRARLLILLAHALVAPIAVRAADPSPAGIELFEEKIRPVLVGRCYRCHSSEAKEIKSGFRLDTREGIRKGGENGLGVVPGKPADSPLIAAIRHEDLKMPPKEKLPDEVIADFVRWVELGAPDPRDGAATPTPEEIRRRAQQHWAFRPPVRPPLPAVKRAEFASHPIDRFISAEHERRGLAPSPQAAKHVLLRRLYLNLVGIAPTADSLAAFEADESADAYERVVDRLLASPLYGQRWGRHWMDVWRYSDWYGWNAEVRNSQKHIWHWRDWIVDSLNADKPYDRMVQEMLAGDELAPSDPGAVAATGFLARNWYRYDRNLWLANTVEHTGKAFLGITINCARCHDHKFDPLAHVEYYKLRAVFEPHDIRIDSLAGQPDVEQDGIPRAYDARPDEPTYLFARGNDKQPDKEHPLAPDLPAALSVEAFGPAAVELPREAYLPGLRAEYQRDVLAQRESEARAGEGKLQAAREQASKAEMAGVEKDFVAAKSAVQLAEAEAAIALAQREATVAAIAADVARYQSPPTSDSAEKTATAAAAQKRVLVAQARHALVAAQVALESLRRDAKPQADIDKQQKLVDDLQAKLTAAEKAVENPGAEYTSLVKQYPARSTGRRLALARWITDRRNPLCARVAVNHIWARHFGAPLVPTAFNFGHAGQAPSHGELLDWLAVELMESGWSMKHLHKLIVTSHTYAMQSWSGADNEANQAIDRENRYLWRQNVRRMDAETVRDSVLAAAGRLDVRLGGPPLSEQDVFTTWRRSLYYRQTPQDRAKFLEVFDAANPEACYLRTESVVPQQALAMLNGTLAREQARSIAGVLSAALAGSSSGDAATADTKFVEAAFLRVLSRRPSDAESAACSKFLSEQAELLSHPEQLSALAGAPAQVAPSRDPRQRARENLVHVLFNHNDFVTIR